MKTSIVAFGLLSLGSSHVRAWGDLGHETVGAVAQAFLVPKALTAVQSMLKTNFSSSLSTAATWADEVRSEPQFAFSAPFHFVDAEDSPLSGSCSVEETRDCGTQDCILTAIANYTARLQDTSLSTEQRLEALLFVDHFLGDIGQPLHVEALEVGGNDIKAVCSGASSTNLHAVWDTGIITNNLNENFGGSVTKYAASLVTRIQSGDFESQTSAFLNCVSTTKTLSTRRTVSIEEDIGSALLAARATTKVTPLACPLTWAQEANAFDCSFVFNFSTGEDLCSGTYFKGAVPIIDLQLAKQGYRLAAWLNTIFAGSAMLP